MQIIKYDHSESDSTVILKNRRNELHLTQQQVADGAKIQFQQYQRLESGERSIENASMRIAMSICAVLKLDPYIFFPDCKVKNQYADSIKSKNTPMIKEDAIPLLLEKACELFNEKLQTNYSLSNIKVAYCTLQDAVSVYKDFTTKYGFHSEKRKKNDFVPILAEAFVGQTDIDDPDHVDGLLIRIDPPADLDRPDYYMMMIVHELAHIFCTTHETDLAGKVSHRFYDLYCADEPGTPAKEYNNGFMNAGYAIWREFIADIMQDYVYQQPSKHLEDIVPILMVLANEVRVGNTDAKYAFHRYLSEILNSWEGSEIENWDELEQKLQEQNLPFIRIVEYVNNNLYDEYFYTITPDFIESLGAMYISDMIKNTPADELMNFAEAFGDKFRRDMQ